MNSNSACKVLKLARHHIGALNYSVFAQQLLYLEGLVVLQDRNNCICGVAAPMYKIERGL
jgi:hypothetical protein